MLLLLLLGSLYYIDQPYLSTPYHGEFGIELRFGPEGEILGYFDVGVWDRFQFGVSYGAANLIGAGDPHFYDIPGVQLRIVAIEQGYVMPHVMLGFDNQGYGAYDDGRYDIMSKGLYCQIGRIFSAPSIECVPSLGVNYSLEDEGRFDLFCGIKALFGTGAAFSVDYSPNLNDDLDQNKGYLNVSLQFIFYEELFFEFALRDLLDNSLDGLQFNRMIRMGLSQVF
ncbi:MAG: hypothetical protein JSW02_01315 [candidate division WOR-3 bacterium]|nr:MAG: hypothetical protein JSW02_01315 [candidate division WOR-3 bacterium]